MTIKHLRIAAVIAALLQFGAGEPASAASPGKNLQIGTTLPDNFPAIENFYLGKPIFGFGSAVGRVDQAVRPGRLLPLNYLPFSRNSANRNNIPPSQRGRSANRHQTWSAGCDGRERIA